MAEAKKTRGTAAKRATRSAQKAITDKETKADDKVIEEPKKPVVMHNVVGEGVPAAMESTPTNDDEVALLKKKIEML